MKALNWLVIGTLVFGGCASMKTTSVTRNDDDSYVAQCPQNGVPVTVKIPTHLKVEVREQLYFVYDKDLNTLKSHSTPGRRNLKVYTEHLVTEKVIFVDVKRPAAGSLDYNLKFDSKGQAITQYESFLFDRTAEDSANLLAQLIPGINPQTGDFASDEDGDDKYKSKFQTAEGTATSPDKFKNPRDRRAEDKDDPNIIGFDYREPKDLEGNEISNVISKERIVAYKVFDINAPDFEDQVQCFLAKHVNDCGGCLPSSGSHVAKGESQNNQPIQRSAFLIQDNTKK